MKASLRTKRETNALTLTIQEVDWEEDGHASFYAGAVRGPALRQVSGQAVSEELVSRKDVTAPRGAQGGQPDSRKEATPGHSQTRQGEVGVERQLQPRRVGGETVWPRERNGQLRCGAAPPLVAEVVSGKLASPTAREVEQDLAQWQGLAVSDPQLRALGEQSGQLAVERAARWQLGGPALAAPVATLATGVDGPTLPRGGEASKEARCGTSAVSDAEGARRPTEDLGPRPEAGKAPVAAQVTSRGAQVLARYPTARPGCVGDGAQWNGDFFAAHYPGAPWGLAFYPAATQLPTAAELSFGAGADAAASYDRWRTTLVEEPNGVAALRRSLSYYRNRPALPPRTGRALETELNSFRTHSAERQDADFRAATVPLGRGVTAAGCKELLTARFCRSGRRWKRTTGAPLLQLRSIRLSQHWDSVWSKILRYAA